MKILRASVCILILVTPIFLYAELPPLIPRAVIFGNPTKTQPRVSPDGAHLAYLAPNEKGVLNVWVRSFGKQDDVAVTRENHRGIPSFRWAQDNRHILYEQDSDGDENWHIYSVDLETRQTRDLTPFLGAKAENLLTSPAKPDEILVGINLKNPRVFDMYRIGLKTGAVVLEAPNPGDVLSWTTDPQFVIRAATAFDPKSGDTILRVRDSAHGAWRDLVHWPFERAVFEGQINGGTVTAGFTPDGRALYVKSALHTDKANLVLIDAQNGRELRSLAADADCDVGEDPAAFPNSRPFVLVHPVTGKAQAVAFESLDFKWKFLDAAVQKDFEFLERRHEGFLNLISRDTADQKWVIVQFTDNGPQRFYVFDRRTKTEQLLWVDVPELEKYSLPHRKPIIVQARDGRKLVSYLTLPVGVPERNLPLIVYPHGGPWARDDWGFDPFAQFLANRGYAVLQVNFRGSTTFGIDFFNAGNHQFGVGMQDDITDAVKWAVNQGIADPKRLAIWGASGGGYAALRGLTETPDLYACGIDLFGPSDLKVLFETMPSDWGPVKTRWVRRIGDAEHDEELNRKLSPLYHVDRVRVPVLVGQGVHDPRVKIKNSDIIVKALREKGVDVAYVVYSDEGHGFGRPENALDFSGRMEEFLAKHLGGRAEPLQKIAGTTAELK